MSEVKLVYFEGCPNSKNARAALLSAGIAFDILDQNILPPDSPFRQFSSPTVLKGNAIVYGTRIPPGSSACSMEKFNEIELKERLTSSISGGAVSSRGWVSTLGSLGSSAVAGLCPVCIPAVAALLSSLGMGFLVNEAILEPALLLLLGITIFGLAWSYRREHGNVGPLLLGTMMSITMYVGRYVILGPVNVFLMYGSIPGIIAASAWNWKLRKRKSCTSCKD